MQTNTIFYRLQEASLNLNFIQKGFLKFNEKGELDRAGTIDPDKLKVLVKIFENIQSATVVHLTYSAITTFKEALNKYNTTPANSKVSRKVNEIKEFVDRVGRNVLQCCQENLSKIIDKALCVSDLTDSHVKILQQFLHSLIAKRIESRILCRYIAVGQKINSLQKLCKNTEFLYNASERRILLHVPFDGDSIRQLIYIKTQFVLNDYDQISLDENNLSQIESFLKEIVREKFHTKDLHYKQYLQTVLYIFAILELEKNWSNQRDNKFIADFLELFKNFDQTHAEWFYREFCYEHPEYRTLTENQELLNPFMKKEDLDRYSKIVERHSKDSLELNNEWDRLYGLIYKKLEQCKPGSLPNFSHEEFISAKNFISEAQIQTPLLNKTREWEKQFSDMEKEQESLALKKVVVPLIQKLRKKNEAATPLVKENETIVEDEETQVEVRPITFFKIQFDKVTLNKNSPFPMHDRVLEWFINSSLENKKSLIIHNFALVINEIVWRVGLRYEHEKQAALAMLCKVVHPLFNSRLMTITMTFNPDNDNPFGDCYHRTLTQKEQQEDDIKNYIKLADYQKDFPCLPKKIEALESLKNVIYPDCSYVESIDGQIVTVKDPKNDCTIQLFVVV